MSEPENSRYEQFRQRAEPWVTLFAFTLFALVWLFLSIFPFVAGGMAINLRAFGLLAFILVWLLASIFITWYCVRKAWRAYLVLRNRAGAKL